MRKSIIAILSVLCAGALIGAAACAGEPETAPAELLNGGFETADLSGWTVEYGDAFSDDCVSSQKTFAFYGDAQHNDLNVNHTGNWYLCGRGFESKYSGAHKYDRTFACGRTGAIRSSVFVLPEDGVVSMKLAGGALYQGKGSTVKKPDSETCYVGVYLADNDKMIACQHNDYFIEHSEDYVPVNKYESGTCVTDNFYGYTLDLSQYAGQKAYIRVVDNDQSYYYGYISVDDIRVGGGAEAQPEGDYFVKARSYVTEAVAPSEYEIANGDFETGSLAGWTVEGEAFSNDGVTAEKGWWNEYIPYDGDGNYHYGFYRPEATGVMRSTEFELGGSGYISWKLGGCSDNSTAYLRFMVKGGDKDTEVARFSNFKYKDYHFPNVSDGLRLLNMVQYYCDFSQYLGETMYIEVVDNNTDGNELGCITLDSVQTYWEQKPVWYQSESFLAVIDTDIFPESEYQVKNGGFEEGLEEDGVTPKGWTLSDVANPIGTTVAADTWLSSPYNKAGVHLFSGFEHNIGNLENNKGTLTSSPFTVGGCGIITFRLGGGYNPELCYLSLIDADTDVELMRFANVLFNDGTMNLYKADISKYLTRRVKLRLVDNAVAADSWGLLIADSFKTYYQKASSVPSKANYAQDLLNKTILGEDDEYQVYNGNFETGDLSGWTLSNPASPIGAVVSASSWLGYPYNKEGLYLFSGFEHNIGNIEGNTGTLTSSAFTVGGCGWMTFLLGGGKNPDLCYVSIIDADTEVELLRFANKNMLPQEGSLVSYKADLTSIMGRSVKIRLVDNATEGWGLLTADNFITHYESESDIASSAILAQNLK